MDAITRTTLADLALSQPFATRVFLRHHLDFCCGGQRTLAEACASAGLDAQQVASELATESAGPLDSARWAERSQAELADHIVERYHTALRRDLPPLIEAAARVERVHAARPAVPAGLSVELETFWAEMQAHMAREEQVLFPMLRRDVRGPMVAMPVEVMTAEHEQHAAHLARIRQLTGDLELPAHACATWAALYRGLITLEAELMEHVHLENHLLFRRALGDR